MFGKFKKALGGDMSDNALSDSEVNEIIATMQDLEVVYQPPAALDPYQDNHMVHDDDQVDLLAKSIKELGFLIPVLVDQHNMIIAGHGRIMAATKLGLTRVPTIPVSHLTEQQKHAYVIMDNRLAQLAGVDVTKLFPNIEKLISSGFDIELLGYSPDDLTDLADDFAKLSAASIDSAINKSEEDDIPEIEQKIISRAGDIWILGKHKLMCGDSAKISNVEQLMDGKKADIFFTDPPYGIDFKPQRDTTHDKILNDNLSRLEFEDFLNSVFHAASFALKPNAYAFIWTGWPKLGSFEKCVSNTFEIKAFHIWVKNHYGIGYYSRPKHEPFYLALKGKPQKPAVAPDDVWEAKKVYKPSHSCEKPVCLVASILDSYDKKGTILDLFAGSGSTLIACEQTDRKCYTMELDPKYSDLIIRRWQNFTGQKAMNKTRNKSFDELEAITQ